MKIISFAWTTPALLAGRKTCTRRTWSDDYARRFKAGEIVAAYDRGPRNGGKQVAIIRLLQTPYQERVNEAPDPDYEAEGLQWMEEQGKLIQGLPPSVFWRQWQRDNPLVWVVRFELINGAM